MNLLSALLAALLLLPLPAHANQPDVTVTDDGKAVYNHGDGSPTPLLGPKKVVQAVLAPDDRTVALIEMIVQGTPAYDEVQLVRPDGTVMLTVPGSRDDEGGASVDRWLKTKGWSAF